MRDAYWASMALMWIVTVFACLMYWRDRRKLRAAIPKPGELFTAALGVSRTDDAALGVSRTDDAALAEWCRHMTLTVWTHTGTVFQETLADLARSDVPDFRNWNVPIQVSIWSDQVDDDFKAVVARTTEENHG